MTYRSAIIALSFSFAVAPAFAAPATIDLPEPQFKLKPATGVDTVMANCQSCHSLDYVITQPPHMGDKFWDAEVQKMTKTFGAPISDTDAKTIAGYLKQNY